MLPPPQGTVGPDARVVFVHTTTKRVLKQLTKTIRAPVHMFMTVLTVVLSVLMLGMFNPDALDSKKVAFSCALTLPLWALGRLAWINHVRVCACSCLQSVHSSLSLLRSHIAPTSQSVI
jgi:hypothetical protein